MPDFDRIFDDMESISTKDVAKRTPKISVRGEHKVKIEEIRIQESEQINATYFVVSFRPIESSSPEVKIGELYSWTVNLLMKFGKKQVGKAHAKQCLAAIMGIDPDSEEADRIGGQHFEEATEDDQPLAGQIVGVRTDPRVSEEDRHWTFHDWYPVDQAA